jgi:succinate-acetate transporter protein
MGCKEEIMASFAVCPYYGCNEDVCDVGCGYISSHDASQISRYCSADYQACPKLIELLDRDDVDQSMFPELPVPFQKKTSTFVSGESGVAIGLAVTGLAILVYALQKFGLFGDNVHFTGGLILAISIMQMLVGMVAINKLPIRGMMFLGSGLLWASLLVMDLLPAAGIGASPGKFALSGYLYLWGLFCLFPLQSAVRVSFSCRLFFGLFAAYLLLLAATPSIAVPLHLPAVVTGVAAGLVGLSVGLRYLLQQVGAVSKSQVNRVRV